MENIVAEEWNRLQKSNDLIQLREFVQLFGSHFKDGQKAQMLLIEKLIKSQNDDLVHEAEIYLNQIMANRSNEQEAGIAAEALAKSLIKKQHWEDAVAIYSQLGNRFANTVIRDGKTGTDIFNETLSDRRLLPYLEPARPRSFGPVKVERKDDSRGMNTPQNMFIIEPEGDLSTFYKRFNIVVELNTNGVPNWSLKLVDKTTKNVRCKFDGLMAPSNISPPTGSWTDVRLAQADGHILLVHFGMNIYCFDLAEKKLIWQYNMLGGSGVVPNVQAQTVNSDGEFDITFEDGWMVRLSRSMVLRDGIAAFMTRDGLMAFDVSSGQKLWHYANISTKSMIFGDGKHIFVAEPGSVKSTSKVFRAVDGTVVNNVPDFSKLALDKSRIKIIDRKLLIFKTNDKKKTIRLYDPLEGKDVWSESLDETTILTNVDDPNQIGFVDPKTGAVQILNTKTGKKEFVSKFNSTFLLNEFKTARDGQFSIIKDHERVYITSQLDMKSNVGQVNYGYTANIRYKTVNGPIICFDRKTSELKWFTRGQFENQKLIMDRFQEMPVLLAASDFHDGQTGTAGCEIMAIDKASGKVKYFDKKLASNGPFQSLELDPKTGNFELKRYDTRIIISSSTPTKD
jgi:outer membrane protein assembly factor BamB